MSFLHYSKLPLRGVGGLLLILLASCTEKKGPELTPWGTPIDDEGAPIVEISDTADSASQNGFTLSDIRKSGEMIMLTVSGPETYYDYRGHGLGLQFMVCEKFAQYIGVSLRVEVCKDSAEVMQRLDAGEGDIAVFAKHEHWKLSNPDGQLASEFKQWYNPSIEQQTQKELKNLLAHGMVKRRVYPFMLNRQAGTISKYDGLFHQYAPTARLEWTLLAAQCYQESCFDPNAKSWAGACGLMQIMPSTADHIGLPRSDMFKPEPNIRAAALLMKELQGKFSDIPVFNERIRFSLAAYNAGTGHIRDAMALTKKYGGNPQRWSDVKPYVLKLMQPQYYRDPVVKCGYMRGTETAGYVDRIMERWDQYRHATHGRSSYSSSSGVLTPQPATRKNKYTK